MRSIRIFALALLAFWLAAGMPARAQQTAQQAASPFDENALRAYVSQQVAAAAGQQVTRFDVQLGSLDGRVALAPCRRSEPFVATGARLWGRSSLGVRCIDGATWSVLLPLTVKVWGQTLVAAAPLSAGTVLTAADLREQEVELTREPPGLLRELAQLQGRTLTRPLAMGQALRSDMVRLPNAVQAGDSVRLRITGAGFAVMASGQALNAAADGQPLRVRSERGKILTGIAREGRLVEVAL
jgi:flagellar basal body P-ring formation protein FlgA